MMTGTVIGYNRTGRSTSRLLTRTSIAANNVPTAANPMVPATRITANHMGCSRSGAWNRSVTSGTSRISAARSSATIPSSLPKVFFSDLLSYLQEY